MDTNLSHPNTPGEKKRPALTDVPDELADAPEARFLWPRLLRRSEATHLAKFGLPDLAFRLKCQLAREQQNGAKPDMRKRALIWWHAAQQCSPGTSEIPNLITPAEIEKAIRAWTPTEQRSPKTITVHCLRCNKKIRQVVGSKFSSCLACRKSAQKSNEAARQLERTGELPEGWKICPIDAVPFEAKPADQEYCSERCKMRAYRARRKAEKVEKIKAEFAEALESHAKVLALR